MKKNERIIVFGIGLVLLGIFTFTDLQISLALFTKNMFGRVFEVIGELPFLTLSLFGTILLFRFRSKTNLAINLLGMLGFGFLSLSFAAMGGFMTFNYLSENIAGTPSFVAIIISTLLLVGTTILAYKVPEKSAHKAVTFGIIALVYFLLVIIVMNTIKASWGRMRIREMTQPLLEFTPWYVITNRGGFHNTYASFPSGHSMNSAAIILCTLLPSFVPMLANKTKLLKVITYVWLLLVGASRVVMGAHFASDVVVGLMLSLLIFELTTALVSKIRKENLLEAVKK